MAENITLNNIATFQNDTSAANTYNSNNTAIVNAFADVLSRSGVGPNQMQSTLDMNNFQIINLPAPTTAGSPARLADISGGQITISTATTGTSGHAVPFLDGTNTWSAPQTFTVNSGTGQVLSVNQTSTGTIASSPFLNFISVADTINAGGNFVDGLVSQINMNSTAVQGGRQALVGAVILNSPTNAANPNRNYVSVVGITLMQTADNGTSPSTAGTSAGSAFGGNLVANLSSSATSFFNVCGCEFNVTMSAGSSAWAKSLAQFSAASGDAVNGSGINTMLWLYNQSGSTSKWTNAILIDNAGGTGVFPISGSGTIFKTGTGSVANGIDFSSTTFSTNAFLSSGFAVGATGNIATGAATVSSGSIQFNGITSGSASISSNSTGTLLTVSQPVQIGVIGTTAGTLTLAGQTSGSAQISCSATGSNLQLGAGNITIDTGGNIVTNAAARVGNITAPVAGGDTAHAYFMSSTGQLGIYYGSGAPTITAAQGSIYLRTDGVINARMYINTTGSNVWTAFNTIT